MRGNRASQNHAMRHDQHTSRLLLHISWLYAPLPALPPFLSLRTRQHKGSFRYMHPAPAGL